MKTRPLYIGIFLFLSFGLCGQVDSPFSLEFSYGITNTMSSSQITSQGNGLMYYEVSGERNLTSSNFALALIVNLNKTNAIKLGVGRFQNGRILDLTVSQDDGTSFSYQDARANYFYRYFGLSHQLEFTLFNESFVSIENGISLNARIKQDEIFFFINNPINWNVFHKSGLGTRIFDDLKIGGRFTFYHYLNDFFPSQTMEGFKPISIGGEVFLRYLIL